MMGLSCDVCGGTDFIKSGDYFKCENCGMKYSLESIRAMTSDTRQEGPANSSTPETSEAEDQTSEASEVCGDVKSPSEEEHTVHQPEDSQADAEESSDVLLAKNSQKKEKTNDSGETGESEDGQTNANADSSSSPSNANDKEPLSVMLSWCDSDKKRLRADIRDPTNDQSFTYELKHTRTPEQDEREFCQDFAERIERDLGRRVEYSMPGQSKGIAMWSRIDAKQALIAGAALFAIGALAHLTGFDMKLIGLSVQMWCLILYAILLTGYFKHHSGKIGQALTILYWCFTLLVCAMQANTWITNNSFTFFKPPFVSDSNNGAVDTPAGKPSSGTTTETVKQEPFLQTLKKLGEFEEKQVSGTGDSVVPIPCYPKPCLITIAHSGDGNFAVKSYDANGNYTDLLVNTIGFYVGQVTTYFDYAESAQLEIKASGNWAMTFKPMSAMTRVVPDPAEEHKGGIFTGDYVVYIDDESLKAVGFVHKGSSNFSVKAVAPTETKLLVNTIGEYSGTVIWNEPQSFYVVHADGSWAIAW